ncbi:MAG: hypothetical protein GTO14_02500 [Anaerolineales bacterium]|nr:hypothetical protein [Anaerolineales bacterium]
MKGNVSKIVLLLLALSLTPLSVANAEEERPTDRLRVFGEITEVDLGANAFVIHTKAGEELRFLVDEETRFRSPDGSVKGLEDLDEGKLAIVIGIKQDDGTLLAKVVGSGRFRGESEVVRAVGEITEVNSTGGSFSLEKQDGQVLVFETDEHTRFRSRDGSIQGVKDLEPGMVAAVVAVEQEDGSLLALLVAAAHKEDLPKLKRFKGEITNVVPGQDTFTISTKDGMAVSFITNERTRFVSRGGSIEDIHDLKKGMIAIVGAREQEDGTLVAVVVAAGYPSDLPGTGVDVRAAGRIVDLGVRSFTIEKRNGDRMTFDVDDETIYRSRDGSVNDFGDLKIGMIAMVGANRLEDGHLKAVWVGAAKPMKDRPDADETRPYRQPSEQNEIMTPASSYEL